MSDWVTAVVERDGDTALRRKLRRLRDIADRSGGPGTPAFQQYGDFYDLLQNTPTEKWSAIVADAEREERAGR
jgi:hypothetical protein